MADGDTFIDEEREFQDGTQATLFAIENSNYSGGIDYRYFPGESPFTEDHKLSSVS